METSFWLPILSLVVTVGSYLVLFTASLRLARLTRKKGFAYLTAGFACWLMEQLILFLAPTDFLLAYTSYYSLLHTLGLILIVVGFFRLVGRGGADCEGLARR